MEKSKVKIPKTIEFLGNKMKLEEYAIAAFVADGKKYKINIDPVYSKELIEIKIEIYGEFITISRYGKTVENGISKLEKALDKHFKVLGNILGREIEG
jgi:hypothetical protein